MFQIVTHVSRRSFFTGGTDSEHPLVVTGATDVDATGATVTLLEELIFIEDDAF